MASISPEEVKKKLAEKNLIQDDLYGQGGATGLITGLGGLAGTGLTSKAKNFAFTIVDGTLIMTPIYDDHVLVDDVIRLTKKDVQCIELKSKLMGTVMEITGSDGKKQSFSMSNPLDGIQAIVKKFNS